MCIICIDFQRGALKSSEARRALGEMRVTLEPSHVLEIEEALDLADGEAAAPPSGTPPTKP